MILQSEQLLNTLYTGREKILQNLRGDEIEVYLFLRKQFKETNVSKNLVFQYMFRKYFVMDRWTDDQYTTQFFKTMQRLRPNAHIDQIPSVCKDLKLHDKTGKIHFSYATKMFHLLNPEIPIYDSMVAKVFRFNPPYSRQEDIKLNKYLEFLKHISKCYEAIKKEDKIDSLIASIQEEYPQIRKAGYTKVMDFMIWSLNRN